MDGNEVINDICKSLAASQYKLDVKEHEVKAQVVNKAGEWVDFEPAKIRFVYAK